MKIQVAEINLVLENNEGKFIKRWVINLTCKISLLKCTRMWLLYRRGSTKYAQHHHE